MKMGSFEFNLRELAGSMGDFGTLFPLAIGYIAVCGLDPSGMLVMMGLANIVTGLVYALPMPIEPMKVLAVAAIAQSWSPSMVYASGFAMGIVWLLVAAGNLMRWVVRVTPKSVVRGIQVALGVTLALKAWPMLETSWWLALVSILIVLVWRQNRYAPAAIVLVALGLAVMAAQGSLAGVRAPHPALPRFALFPMSDVWRSMVLAGFAQVPLTAANAVIATAALIREYWPDRPVGERKLALNMGIMNGIMPFFGGMPLCHGAGGLAGQYFFGARTGGTNIIEGTLEILLGVFLAGSIGSLFAAFPAAIVGAMMFLVGLELLKFLKDVQWREEWLPLAATVAVALAFDMAWGFLAGLAVHHGLRWARRR